MPECGARLHEKQEEISNTSAHARQDKAQAAPLQGGSEYLLKVDAGLPAALTTVQSLVNAVVEYAPELGL